MTEKTDAISDIIHDQSQFQEIFPIHQTKFAHVKYKAMQLFIKE
jgi:hypothetical protein